MLPRKDEKPDNINGCIVKSDRLLGPLKQAADELLTGDQGDRSMGLIARCYTTIENVFEDADEQHVLRVVISDERLRQIAAKAAETGRTVAEYAALCIDIMMMSDAEGEENQS